MASTRSGSTGARLGWPLVPWTVQGHLGSEGCLFAGTGPLRSVKPGTRENGPGSCRMALEQLPGDHRRGASPGLARWRAVAAYRQFVMAGLGSPSPLDRVRHQVLLGDDAFVAKHQHEPRNDPLREVSKAHRRSVAFDLTPYQERYPARAQEMAQAYLSGAYTMAEIGRHFGVHYMMVSRAVKGFEWRNRQVAEGRDGWDRLAMLEC